MFNQNCCHKNNNMFENQLPQGCQRQIQEVVEPVINKCVEKVYQHEVPHICPIHTHIINKHIYNHTYTPRYSCSEENQIINNDCGKCSGFMN